MITEARFISMFVLLLHFLPHNACLSPNSKSVMFSKNSLNSADKLTEKDNYGVKQVNIIDQFTETIENKDEFRQTNKSNEIIENKEHIIVKKENLTNGSIVTIENTFHFNKVKIKSVKMKYITFTFTYVEQGTKWCGAGNVAESYDDLGSERETDMCCRAHDFCPDIIEAGESKYNLTNDAFYTRLSCECDEVFRQCLRATKRRTARNIGTVYFNLLGTKCFRNEYPTEQCVRRGGWLKRKCLEYTYDTNSSKYYQWFDVNDY